MFFVPGALFHLKQIDVNRMVEWYTLLGKLLGIPAVVLVAGALLFTLVGGRRDKVLWLLMGTLAAIVGIIVADEWLPNGLPDWVSNQVTYALAAAYTLAAILAPLRWFRAHPEEGPG